ncbi:acetyl-CoA carboxylase biotin carboxylase subunit family protein [Streptomyces roseolus]|uniref:acetyl-CoA carboxylase biotin carboxylase subunit family protein n=1 Tax=Streptomyces roseolus TaxID=67358 RepID=UPI003797269D
MTTTGAPGLPHVVVINRWRERYARYAEYLDHTTHHVSYVSTEVGLPSVPEEAGDLVVVERTDDLEAVRAAVRVLAVRHGRPERIVALKEDDLLIAAALREEWDCPGQRTGQLARFRDKYLMASAVADAGLELPEFALATDEATVLAFADRYGWPVIVKPVMGSSSEGVAKLDGPEELASLRLGDGPMMVQRFHPGLIYHVDGVFTGEEIRHLRASRYVNTCLGFRSGEFLGSVEEDDEAVNEAIREASAGYLRALSDEPLVFHLEVFVDRSSGAPRCSFLEVGARVGGAEIPFVWREVHGYDLMDAAFQLQMRRPIPEGEPGASGEVGGFLIVPAPEARPCRITEVTSMTGRVPGLYAEALLEVGEVLPLADAYYEHVGGRFRFRGAGSAEVEAAVVAAASGFRVAGVPADAPEEAAEEPDALLTAVGGR